VTRADRPERDTPISVTYFVDRMRVLKPSGKTAMRNPERVYTVNGIFYSTDEFGQVKDKLSIITKNIDYSDVQSPEFALDVRNGFLTLPEGKRGRIAQQGLSEDEILAELSYLRGETYTDEIGGETPTTDDEIETPAKKRGK
jgi:hypothetical protein